MRASTTATTRVPGRAAFAPGASERVTPCSTTRSHTRPKKQYRCAVCGSTSRNAAAHCDLCACRQYLPRHARMQKGEKPYKCSECLASFNEKNSLTRHILTHTGERPHHQRVTCAQCFRTPHHLACHTRVHTGEMTYPYRACGKSFSRKITTSP
ncbi:hypothetical protein HPB52_014276 [Rhipicephalus sanguineus]|uniref:C2H2-type domain-containing protein n=1 Tax=Rhipicephalus sanguineus TaxID=34632 RepID=A0A9D4PCG8_RHISA|nr:hypothetical protein HPB52_014276 [Rhipicephalus sanguineus]